VFDDMIEVKSDDSFLDNVDYEELKEMVGEQ
jgi:hypothetical protein